MKESVYTVVNELYLLYFIDFEIENAIPQTVRYSEKITKLITEHRDLLVLEADRASSTKILNLIKEEEHQSDLLKKNASTVVAAADAIDPNGFLIIFHYFHYDI